VFGSPAAEWTGVKLSEIDVTAIGTAAMGWTAMIGNPVGLLAEAEGAAGPLPNLPFPALIAIMLGLFYFIILRPQQKKDKDFRTLLEGLKEKDRVVTIGGIHGVVTNVQRDRDEVTLRIDESTGAKLRVNLSAISRLVTDEEKK
jgi:preprotein translocase subunit YajC